MLLCLAMLLGSCSPGEPEAGLAPAPPSPIVQLVVSPSSATIDADAAQQFAVSAVHQDGDTSVPTVVWTATGGSIAANGLYTPSGTAGSYSVTASLPGTGLGASAPVTVVAVTSPILSVTVAPGTANLNSGETASFLATAQREDGSATTPSVIWTATGGTISTGGVYTAGINSGSYRAIATLAGGTLADSAEISITAPVLEAIVLHPGSASVVMGGARLFTVTGQWSNGATTPPPVSFSASGGTISANGLYTAGTTTGTFTVVATQQGGTLADTSTVTVTVAPPNDMYFNSSEIGCGTDANVLMCDDFEDGDWYTKHCDAANASGGLLQTDGWCGTIYNNAGLAAGTAHCGGVGFRSSCAATTGVMPSGTDGKTGNMGDHGFFAGQGVEEVWVRFYTKPLPGYQFGAEKMLTFNDGNPGGAGIRWGNLSWNCAGLPPASGIITMGFPSPMDICQRQNVGTSITIVPGNWYFYEVHYRLNSPGQSNGVFELWVDNCGPSGTSCPSTPTLRMRRTDVGLNRSSSSQLIKVLWFEAWSNPVSRGERYWDQIVVSKVGPIGFMP